MRHSSNSIDSEPLTSVASASTGAMYFNRSRHIGGVIGVWLKTVPG